MSLTLTGHRTLAFEIPDASGVIPDAPDANSESIAKLEPTPVATPDAHTGRSGVHRTHNQRALQEEFAPDANSDAS